MQKSNTRTPWVFYVGLIILCCFLVSTHFTGGLYAKYSTTSYGEDSARVAKFNVTNAFQDSQPVDLKLNFFDIKALSQTVNIVVNSDSEVAIKYDVIITMPEKDKLGNDVSYDDWLVVTVDDKPTTFEANVFTYSVDANTIAPNDTTQKVHTVKLAIADERVGKPPYGLSDVEDGTVIITVHAEQVD